jgi:hypothetical protein
MGISVDRVSRSKGRRFKWPWIHCCAWDSECRKFVQPMLYLWPLSLRISWGKDPLELVEAVWQEVSQQSRPRSLSELPRPLSAPGTPEGTSSPTSEGSTDPTT